MAELTALFFTALTGSVLWFIPTSATSAFYGSELGWNPLLVGLVCAAAQTLGYVFLYGGGYALVSRWAALQRRVDDVRDKHGARLERAALPTTFAAGALGVPPMFGVATLAPAFRIPIAPFLGLAFCGRWIRYATFAAAGTALSGILSGLVGTSFAHEGFHPWPQTILVTNEGGIDDPTLLELARALSKIGQTTIVAPRTDRTGTSNLLSLSKTGSIQVESRNLVDGLAAYAVDGTSADCMAVALGGILRQQPPDLVISGIEADPNLGQEWIGSGAVEAARLAAFADIPAMAISGLDPDIPGATAAATEWIIRLAQSQAVQSLEPNQYLTVTLPRTAPHEIKGVRVTERAGLLDVPIFAPVTPENESGTSTWKLQRVRRLERELPVEHDIALHQQGYIVIVPMRVDEQDSELRTRLEDSPRSLPGWDPESTNPDP